MLRIFGPGGDRSRLLRSWVRRCLRFEGSRRAFTGRLRRPAANHRNSDQKQAPTGFLRSTTWTRRDAHSTHRGPRVHLFSPVLRRHQSSLWEGCGGTAPVSHCEDREGGGGLSRCPLLNRVGRPSPTHLPPVTNAQGDVSVDRLGEGPNRVYRILVT